MKESRKLTLLQDMQCSVKLKMWDPKVGFYMDYEKNEENSRPALMCEGKTLKQCVEDLQEEQWFPKRSLFSMAIAEQIIETFEFCLANGRTFKMKDNRQICTENLKNKWVEGIEKADQTGEALEYIWDRVTFNLIFNQGKDVSKEF